MLLKLPQIVQNIIYLKQVLFSECSKCICCALLCITSLSDVRASRDTLR